jgi:hypothetical protein
VESDGTPLDLERVEDFLRKVHGHPDFTAAKEALLSTIYPDVDTDDEDGTQRTNPTSVLAAVRQTLRQLKLNKSALNVAANVTRSTDARMDVLSSDEELSH